MGEGARSIRLAEIPPFRLGDVLVDPPRRRISRDGREELLEPRVMQVLVVLAEARGGVISRDELIERCWDGRIVGENAINRVISRIRQTASEVGMDSFQLETITKVGYRMVIAGGLVDEADAADGPGVDPGAVPNPSSPVSPVGSRRLFIAGGLALAAAGGAGAWLWSGVRRHVPDPESVELARLGQIAQRQGIPEQVRQAVSFFTQATRIDPLYAEGWGGLALSYRHMLEGFADIEKDSLPGLIESAARRAIALDPDNADAQVALVIIAPYFRNWTRMEAELRRLGERFPDHWFVQAQLGIIRYETGRWREGLPHTEHELRVEPFLPVAHMFRARALWALGRLQEAQAAIDAAIQRWPADPGLWSLKFGFLLFNGRPGSAAAFAVDPQTRPEHVGPDQLARRVTLARAVDLRRPADIEASLEDVRQAAVSGIDAVPFAAPLFVLLGRRDAALEAIGRYYFGGPAGELGPTVAPPERFERRYTSFLFMPSMAALWRHPRFADVLERSGLEDFWRANGTMPDFRRA